MLIIESGVAVDLLMDVFTVIILSIPINMLVDVNVNVFAGVITGFEFAMSGPLEEFSC